MAGEAYVKRYVGGFVDLPTQSTPIDSLFLNLVETEFLRLIGADPIDQGVQVWDTALARIKSIKLTNAQIDPAAAIAKSKLAALNIADADVAAGAAIAKSKLAALNIVDADVAAGAAIAYAKLALTGLIVNADIAAAAAIAISKLAGYPADATKALYGDGTWKVVTSQMDYVEVTSNQNSTATTAATATAIITGNAVAYDGATPVLIEVDIPSYTHSNGNGVVNFNLYDGATDLGQIAMTEVVTATHSYGPIRAARRLTPSNASHTYSIRMWTGSGTATANAGAGGAGVLMPMFIRISRA